MPKSKKSSVFNAGERLEGTMLTIVGPSKPDAWASIRCKCDCGRVVVLPYWKVYRYQFSCGCVPRRNSVDYRMLEVVNFKGNQGDRGGRILTILDRNDQGLWEYTCNCCAEVFVLPSSLHSNLKRNLFDLAGQRCPQWRGEYHDVVDVNFDETLWYWTHDDQLGNFDLNLLPADLRDVLYVSPRIKFVEGEFKFLQLQQVKYEEIARFFEPARIVRRDGRIIGFYGRPRMKAIVPRASDSAYATADWAQRVKDKKAGVVPIMPQRTFDDFEGCFNPDGTVKKEAV